MSAVQDTREIMYRLEKRGIVIDFDEVNILRRAERILHRWAELECGDGDNYKSWAIERDEETGKPFMVTYPHKGSSHRYRIPDREAGALKRVEAICKARGIYFYHQGDPRGCVLYLSVEPFVDHDYTRHGIPCCV